MVALTFQQHKSPSLNKTIPYIYGRKSLKLSISFNKDEGYCVYTPTCRSPAPLLTLYTLVHLKFLFS